MGRRTEVEVIVAALGSGRHILLEGPPGTGKSTLLRQMVRHAHIGMSFVEGNAELTPARLVGHFDPAQVMTRGYDPEVFVAGPLVEAMRSGSLLYVEEVNRVPEETLNLLITVMSERELTLPRLGRVVASPTFRFVAAMNPFDAIGTSRISGALYDRVCRVAMGYQGVDEEEQIVAREVSSGAPDPDTEPLSRRAVAVVRSSRAHDDIRVGSSVRGAIDLVLLATRLAELRTSRLSDDRVGLDAARAALTGRIQVHEASARTPESIVDELWAASAERPSTPPSRDAHQADAKKA